MYYLFVEYSNNVDLLELVERINSIYIPGLSCDGIHYSKLLKDYILFNSELLSDEKVMIEIKDILKDIGYYKEFKILKNLTKLKVLV